VIAKCRYNTRRHCYGSPASGGFGFDQLEPSIDSLQLFRNSQVAKLEIDIPPSQTKRLSLPKAHRESYRIERFKSVTFERLQERPGLGWRQRLDLVLLHPRAGGQSGDISRDQTPSKGMIERASQSASDVPDALRPQAFGALAVDELLYMHRCQPIQGELAKRRLEMKADVNLVACVSPRPDVRSHNLLQPLVQEFAN